MRLFGLFGAAMLLAPANFTSADQEKDWQELNGAEIEKALTGITLDYAFAWQEFRARGKTLYNSGADNWGIWRVEGNQYCCQWPPRDLWDCYWVLRAGDHIRFTGRHGDITDGRIRK